MLCFELGSVPFCFDRYQFFFLLVGYQSEIQRLTESTERRVTEISDEYFHLKNKLAQSRDQLKAVKSHVLDKYKGTAGTNTTI